MSPATRDRLLIALGGFLVLLPGAFWGLPSGKNIAGALVILDGGVPYRDFWAMYAPGQFYAVAALYAIFGREVLVQAVAACVAVVAAAAAFHRLLDRLGASQRLATILAAAFVLVFWRTAPSLTDYELALPLVLVALERAVRYFRDGELLHLRWAGLAAGLAAWSKHDIAAYIVVGICASLLVTPWFAGSGNAAARTPRLRSALILALAALAGLAPMALWTMWTAAQAAWVDLIVFPATVFSKVRGDRFPPLIPDVAPVLTWIADVTHVRKALRASEAFEPWITLWVPALVFVATLGILTLRRPRLAPWQTASLVMMLACMPFFWAAAHVQQNTHPYTLALLVSAIAVVGWASRAGDAAWVKRWRIPVGLAALVYTGALMTTAIVEASLVYFEWPGSRTLTLPGVQGIRLPARLYTGVQPLGEYVRAHVPEGEPVYAGLLRHDAIVINNALLYAIADRPVCCGYTELHPGVADRQPVQAGIVERLESTGVQTLVLWQFGWSDEYMALRKQHTMKGVPDAGSTLLDHYIAERFERVAQFGEYHVFRRRGQRSSGHSNLVIPPRQ